MFCSKITADSEDKPCCPKMLLGKKADRPRQCIEIHFANNGLPNQSYGFSSSHLQMWELIIKKAEHWRTDAFELWCWRRLLIPWTARRFKPVSPKGNQPWIFIRRTAAEAPILWPLDAKSQLIGKVSSAGKDWGQEEKGAYRGWNGWMTSPT